ncbi:hypothetical protein ABNX05_20180 [Lysinibacillus sp. M3]|uniref:Uncharacterized protein n=1 Tax=Lysinibacillus zambalensis TaxID=3160866 RepID=A0ABV1MWS6_9BACI
MCESAATATTGFGFVCAKAQRQQQQDVGHEGVTQDVMLIVFVPLYR